MKNQLISRGLYVEGLRKIKVPAIIFAAIVFIAQFVTPLMSAVMTYSRVEKTVVGPAEILGSMMIIPCLMVPILTLVAFFAFNKRSSSDFYQSLPYTRTCLFFSWILAVLTVTAVLVIGGGLLGYAVRLMFPGYYIVTVTGLADMLLSFVSATLFGMGCVLIAMSLTGTFITNISCSLLLLFLPRLLLFLSRMLILSSSPVLDSNHFLNWMYITHNTYISGIGYGLMSLVSGGSEGWLNNISADIFTLVVGIVYIALAAFLFKRRHSETAGRGSVNRLVQHIIRIAMTLAVAILGTYLWVEADEDIFAIVMYCLAIVLFFAYEIIVTKKWVNLVKVLPSLLIVAALTAGLWLGSYATSKVICSKYMQADQVESIRLPDFLTGNQEYFKEKCENTDITDREIIQTVVDAYNENIDKLKDDTYSSYYARAGLTWSVEPVIFNTNSGTKYRRVIITPEAIRKIAVLISGNQKYMKVFTEIPEPIFESFAVNFKNSYYDKTYSEVAAPANVDDYKELYQVLCEELKTVDPVEWVSHLMTESYEMCDISIEYNADNALHDKVALNISQQLTPKTYEKALQTMAAHQDISDFMNFFNNSTYENQEEVYAGLNVFLYYTDESREIKELSYDNYLNESFGSYSKLKELALRGLASDELPTTGNWLRVEYYYGYNEISQGKYGTQTEYIDRNGTLVIPLVDNWQEILEIEK